MMSKPSADASPVAKDWAPPRSLRAFTGGASTTGISNPPGTTVHAVVNTRIPCTSEEFTKQGKGHISVTIVAIKKLGYAYAPWKKNPKGPKSTEPTKKLFDSPTMFSHGHEKTYESISVYTFPREGTFDKGPRNDAMKCQLEVGQTFHFMLSEFMFERKGKGDSVFPDGVAAIEPFSLIELVIGAHTQENADKGYGIKVEIVRPLDFSLYSYLQPMYMKMLLSKTPDAVYASVSDHAQSAEGKYYTIRSTLESTNIGFLARVYPDAYVVKCPEGDKPFWRLVCDTTDAGRGVVELAGVQVLDIMQDDLLKFTNAGDNTLYARLLMDIAAAGAFVCFALFCNTYAT
jgi:hypothetical protein